MCETIQLIDNRLTLPLMTGKGGGHLIVDIWWQVASSAGSHLKHCLYSQKTLLFWCKKVLIFFAWSCLFGKFQFSHKRLIYLFIYEFNGRYLNKNLIGIKNQYKPRLYRGKRSACAFFQVLLLLFLLSLNVLNEFQSEFNGYVPYLPSTQLEALSPAGV